MFTWICPQCGKEVPPHETECPHCREAAGQKAAAQQQPAPPQPQPAVPQQPPAAPPEQPMPTQQYAPPQQPQYAPPQQPTAPQQPVASQQPIVPQQPPTAAYPPQPQTAAPQAPTPQPPHPQQGQPQQGYVITDNKRSLPGWAVTLIVAAVIVGLGFVIYTYVLSDRGATSATASGESPFEEVPEQGAAAAGGSSRLARHIEATGFRITETADKRLQIQFLVVNHSGADIGDLKGTVHLKTTESDDVISSFDFNTSNLGPYESIEFKAIMTGGMRAYEAPDWQFLMADVEITSPADL